jgi:DNA-binding LytR/AlgR family response regulator
MSVLRVVVVDDEPAARRRSADLATELGAIVIGEAANGLEALERIPALAPDVVLLDVEMPEVDGVEVARRLVEPRPFIVFATAFDQYAAAAFEAEALDFVVKPVSKERLAVTFERARRRLATNHVPTPMSADVVAAVAAAIGRDVHTRLPAPRRVLVRQRNGHRLVPVADVERFFAADNVVCAVVSTCDQVTEPIVDYSLDELELRLTGAFVRINRRDLLAIDRIERIVSTGDGAATVVTRDGVVWRVSRRRTAGVREALVR